MLMHFPTLTAPLLIQYETIVVFVVAKPKRTTVSRRTHSVKVFTVKV